MEQLHPISESEKGEEQGVGRTNPLDSKNIEASMRLSNLAQTTLIPHFCCVFHLHFFVLYTR